MFLVTVNITGCAKQYEVDSSKHLDNAKNLLSSQAVTDENLRLAEFHLIKVDSRSGSYIEAQKILPEVKAKIKAIDGNKKELKTKAVEARKNTTPQMRINYARQYKTDYDRIQVGATAQATGKGNRTLNIHLKYYFDDLVQKNSISYIHNQWAELGFAKVVFYDKTGGSWEKEILDSN